MRGKTAFLIALGLVFVIALSGCAVPRGCATDADCLEGQVCYASVCIDGGGGGGGNSTTTTLAAGECSNSSQCGTGKVCINRTCMSATTTTRASTTTAQTTTTVLGDACTKSSDCAAGELCFLGYCRTA